MTILNLILTVTMSLLLLIGVHRYLARRSRAVVAVTKNR
jgi:hypothetical protein